VVDLNDKHSLRSKDLKSAISEIDKKNCYLSITSLSKQIKQAWEETENLEFPSDYSQAKNIILCGMGGSAYPAYIIKSIYSGQLKVPFELVNGYNLPGYIDENSLVLLSSYSGTTEEFLSCAQQAKQKGAKIAVVASGGPLKDQNIPGYFFNPINNPSGQPRLGTGYMLTGFLGILSKLGYLQVSDIEKTVNLLENQTQNMEELSKELAKKLEEKIPVIVSGEHLSGNAHIIRNQFNETAKNFSTFAILPELNHHLMEGLVHSSSNLIFIFLKSNLYSPKIQKRLELTKDVVLKNNVKTAVVEVMGEGELEQSFYTLSFGGLLTFYLAILYGQDPSVIPWVDYFKQELEK
jgi:glucose/mannose-6-phosphate isomerase